jgi:hypothetical protein
MTEFAKNAILYNLKNPKQTEPLMNLSIYDLAIPSFINSLTALSNILNKAKTHAESKKTDINAFLQSRLIADQFPLSKQIQITCDNAKFFASRLSGIEAPKHPDTETTLEEFQDRIKSTLAFLQKISTDGKTAHNHFSGIQENTSPHMILLQNMPSPTSISTSQLPTAS